MYAKRDLIVCQKRPTHIKKKTDLVGTSLSNVSARDIMLSGNAAETVITGNKTTLAEMIRAHIVVFIPTLEPPV